VQRWLARHPRFHLHFTPTTASWLNMVERFFRDLTQNRLRRGVFRDVKELVMAIGTYIDRHNENPKPFIWTASAADILDKVTRAHRSLNKTSIWLTHYTSDCGRITRVGGAAKELMEIVKITAAAATRNNGKRWIFHPPAFDSRRLDIALSSIISSSLFV
jgi:hypothetical protein